jgi:hypothetical protein
MSEPAYDEPGTRTRQSWLRTGLGLAAVTLLVFRGLILAGFPSPIVVVSVLPGVVVVAVAVARSLQLRPLGSPAISRRMVVVASGATVLLGVVALVSVAGP